MCLQKPAVFPTCLSSRDLGAASIQQLLEQYAGLRCGPPPLFFSFFELNKPTVSNVLGEWGIPLAG